MHPTLSNSAHGLQEQRIGMSHSKTFGLLLIALAFVLCGLWLIMGSKATMLTMLIGALGILFFGACGLVAIKKLFQKEAGLIVNTQGVLDRSSGVSAGFVPWADVLSVEPSFVSGQKFVSLMLHDAEKYARRGNALQQRLAQMNIKLVGTPVNFSANSMKISFDELLALLRTYHQNSQLTGK